MLVMNIFYAYDISKNYFYKENMTEGAELRTIKCLYIDTEYIRLISLI